MATNDKNIVFNIAPRFREVLDLIAQGDETILRIAPDIVKGLRYAGLITRAYKNQQFEYSVTKKGYEVLTQTKAEGK